LHSTVSADWPITIDWAGLGESAVEDGGSAISAAPYELALSLALRFDAGPAPRM
jgi:hypothetical protein